MDDLSQLEFSCFQISFIDIFWLWVKCLLILITKTVKGHFEISKQNLDSIAKGNIINEESRKCFETFR